LSTEAWLGQRPLPAEVIALTQSQLREPTFSGSMDDSEDRTASTICRANKYTAAALHHRPVRVAIRDLGGELPASAVLEAVRIKLGEKYHAETLRGSGRFF
jgi:hypothetical protein